MLERSIIYLTLSSLNLLNGLLDLRTWSHPLLQIGVSVKNQEQNGKQADPDFI